jgi:ATP-dependent DNA helicase RecG
LVTEVDADSPARERLAGVEATLDGFELARLDLEQRREGDVLGVSQSGRKSRWLRLLRLQHDEDIIRAARVEAFDLIGDDPQLSDWPQLAAAVARLADDGRADNFGKT